MKGYTVPPVRSETLTKLKPHEEMLADAVGNVIEFWGFKQNHGRLWAILYLRAEPMTAPAIREELGLSKGAVSMITRELEQWGVVTRVRPRGQAAWAYVAETDLMKMIGRVVREREATLVTRVREDVEIAVREARKTKGVSKDAIERMQRLVVLSKLIESALQLFLKTAKLDVKAAFDALDDDDNDE